jgi:glycolate oxidase FAD binding subunit
LIENLAGVRTGQPADSVDEVVPRFVVEPDSAEGIASVLAEASRERQAVLLRGSGTKLAWGRRPTVIDVLLGTRRINRVLAHQYGDLTATVEAGITIAQLNRELGRHGQWLPLDVTFDEATVGGSIAANDSGPLRHRHGAPRDLLIGVHLAMTDGRVVKAGGNVVKNVAGYDLGKLMSGSFGSLAAIVSATFKLAPLPSSSSTLLAGFRSAEALARAAAVITSSQLEPIAFDVHVFVPTYQLLLRFASTPAAIASQIEEARRLLAADQFDVISDTAETEAWRRHRDLVWSAPGVVIKASWLPAALPGVLSVIQDLGRNCRGAVALIGRAGLGAGTIRVDADTAAQVAAVEHVRRSNTFGNTVVLRADSAVKEQIDVWGASGDTASLLTALKRTFDPAGILNAGRGPL